MATDADETRAEALVAEWYRVLSPDSPFCVSCYRELARRIAALMADVRREALEEAAVAVDDLGGRDMELAAETIRALAAGEEK